MPRSIDDLINNLSKLEDELNAQLPKITLEYAENGIALIIHNIQQGEGIPGKQYSTKEMLVTQSSFLQKNKFKPDIVGETLGRDAQGNLVKGGVRTKKGTIRRASTEKRIRFIKFPHASKAVPVMTLPGGYKMLRQIQGLQTAHVDVTYSGRMLQNTKILSTQERSKFIFLAIIGGINKETKDKLLGNYKHYGDFLALTPKIAEQIKDIPANRIAAIVKNTLG